MKDDASLLMVILIAACVIIVPPVGIGLFILWILYEMQHPAR